MRAFSTIAGAALLLSSGGAAQAATTIDFTGGTDFYESPDSMNNRYTEDGYTFTGKFLVDVHWLDIRGDEMNPAIVMSDEFNRFDVTASGRQFSMSSFDYAGYNSPRSNSITFTGYLNDVKIYTLTEVGNYGRQSGGLYGNYVYGKYTTMDLDFFAAVDRISVMVNRSKQTDLDNFVFVSVPGAVPEPATWTMMLLGFGLMGAAMRTRRRSATLAHA